MKKLLWLVVIGGVAILFLAHMHAQNILIDDYYYFEFYKQKPLAEMIGQILIGMHTGHIRFVFIPHLLFIPFYKYTSGLSQLPINLFFIFGLINLIFVGFASLKLLAKANHYPLSIFYALALVNFQVWVLLDFKLGMYILLGLSAAMSVFLLLNRLNLKRLSHLTILWVAFVIALHTTDLNVLLIAPIAIVLFATKLTRFAKLVRLAPFIVYPPLYIFVITQIQNRTSKIFTEAVDLGKIIGWILQNHYLGLDAPIFLTTLALVATGLVVWFRSKNRSYSSPILVALYLLLFSFAIIFSTAIAYNGYVNPHQYAISYIIMSCSIVLSAGYLLQQVKQKIILQVVVLAMGVFMCLSSIGPFIRHTKLRAHEIQVIEQFKLHFNDLRSFGDVNYIVLQSWPGTVLVSSYSYPAFYEIDWLYEPVANLYLNTQEKRFVILSQNSLLNKEALQTKLDQYDPSSTSTLTYVNYLNGKLEFTYLQCSIFCEDMAIDSLKK